MQAHTHRSTVSQIQPQKRPKETTKFPGSFQDPDAYPINVYSSSHYAASQRSKWYLMKKKKEDVAAKAKCTNRLLSIPQLYP
jgi:hypothetical protein